MYEIFEKLLQERGIKTADVSRATGIAEGTFSNWKKRRNKLSPELLIKIADYFGVSLDYMMGKDDTLYTIEFTSENGIMRPHPVPIKKDEQQPETEQKKTEYFIEKSENAKLVNELVDSFKKLPLGMQASLLDLVKATANNLKDESSPQET